MVDLSKITPVKGRKCTRRPHKYCERCGDFLLPLILTEGEELCIKCATQRERQQEYGSAAGRSSP